MLPKWRHICCAPSLRLTKRRGGYAGRSEQKPKQGTYKCMHHEEQLARQCRPTTQHEPPSTQRQTQPSSEHVPHHGKPSTQRNFRHASLLRTCAKLHHELTHQLTAYALMSHVLVGKLSYQFRTLLLAIEYLQHMDDILWWWQATTTVDAETAGTTPR